MKGVMRFGKKGKLNPRYINPYRISKRTANVAYEWELPPELVVVHPVFHIYMLKNCMGDPSLIIPTENIGIKDNLSYEEIPIEILDRLVRKLRIKEVASFKSCRGISLLRKLLGRLRRMQRRDTHISFILEKFQTKVMTFCKTLFKLLCYVVLNCMLDV
ncbi:hypothetical protein MTR67_023002 [Solanum verrucosum]|uniref:Tf2-1-like SH3-like domain-containing protein n=1 Tax=Solanum verrucosum TaxID=315347 RepID=A0AAF0TR13_SOLVR|nr:hypothetical protein MTR67_023002 [Solanum verrucosum]